MTKQQFNNVSGILERAGYAHLSDCLDFLTHNDIEAVALMAADMKDSGKIFDEVASVVVNDIAGLMEGDASFVAESSKYKTYRNSDIGWNFQIHEGEIIVKKSFRS